MPAQCALPTRAAEELGEMADTLERLDVKRDAFNAGAVIWQAWNTNVTTTSTSWTLTQPIEITTWGSWNGVWSDGNGTTFLYDSGTGQSTQLSGGTVQWTSWNVQYAEETEEQAAARAAREAEVQAGWQRRYAEQQAAEAERIREREQAGRRAQELLLSLLSEQQYASYLERGWFEVRGSKGGRWRIRNNGQSGNVDLMPEIGEEREASYCAHPPGGLPAADAHLAQMLALVTDEDSFLRTANVHYRRPGGGLAPFMEAVA